MLDTSHAKTFGYVRVSTVSQNVDRQIDSLVGVAVDRGDIFQDKISGARQNRPGLDSLLRVLRSGDTVVVHSLDRLGRSALHVMTTIAELSERGISVRSLKPGEDLGGPTGKLMAGLMILVAEWERSMNAERVAEARAARAMRARDGEQVAGRPRTALTPDKIAKAQKLRAKGHGVKDIAILTGMSRASVYRALRSSAT